MGLTDEAVLKIKGMILSGDLRPGDKLPKEADLAEMLGLSRNSLREAVRALTFIRVLRARQGDGTYVTSLEPETLMESLDFVVDLARDRTMLDLVQTRRLLEPTATALAVWSIDEPRLAELTGLLERMGDATTSEEFIEADRAFHETIVGALGNEVLTLLLRSLGSQTVRARIWHTRTEEGAVERARSGHLAIYEAILDRDPERARAAATMHLVDAERWLRRTLGSEATGGPEELKKGSYA